MNNILFCSAGRRCKLLKGIKDSFANMGNVIAIDCNPYTPAFSCVDKSYVVPPIEDPRYITTLLNICKSEQVRAITTLIDPEISLLANNRNLFETEQILPLLPSFETAQVCFDKYEMYKYLRKNDILTICTFNSLEDFKLAYNEGAISFPTFIKPIFGSGSIDARRVLSMNELEFYMNSSGCQYIIQEFMTGDDCDVDVYVDCISHKAVSIFSKKKIETRIGGASKTMSFKDQKLFNIVQNIVDLFEFSGPIDMDFFYKDGEYYLSEINPRFGGAYIHAHAAGVDFVQLILNNIEGITNQCKIGEYDENLVMMMYDDIIIKRRDDILLNHLDFI